jgi:hypothetical protein
MPKEILSGDRLSRPDEQAEIDDETSDQRKEDAGSRHDVPIMPQIPSGFGQNRGILFFAGDNRFRPEGQIPKIGICKLLAEPEPGTLPPPWGSASQT